MVKLQAPEPMSCAVPVSGTRQSPVTLVIITFHQHIKKVSPHKTGRRYMALPGDLHNTSLAARSAPSMQCRRQCLSVHTYTYNLTFCMQRHVTNDCIYNTILCIRHSMPLQFSEKVQHSTTLRRIKLLSHSAKTQNLVTAPPRKTTLHKNASIGDHGPFRVYSGRHRGCTRYIRRFSTASSPHGGRAIQWQS